MSESTMSSDWQRHVVFMLMGSFVLTICTCLFMSNTKPTFIADILLHQNKDYKGRIHRSIQGIPPKGNTQTEPFVVLSHLKQSSSYLFPVKG
jgi:hypothetical protein